MQVAILLISTLYAATEANPLSVCAYCTESHAGIRWMLHDSQKRLESFHDRAIEKIDIGFRCNTVNEENNTVSHLHRHICKVFLSIYMLSTTLHWPT